MSSSQVCFGASHSCWHLFSHLIFTVTSSPVHTHGSSCPVWTSEAVVWETSSGTVGCWGTAVFILSYRLVPIIALQSHAKSPGWLQNKRKLLSTWNSSVSSLFPSTHIKSLATVLFRHNGAITLFEFPFGNLFPDLTSMRNYWLFPQVYKSKMNCLK